MPAMNPRCPGCLNEMSKAAAARNLFNCEPCREIIQFFDFRSDLDRAGRLAPSHTAGRPIGNTRAA